MYCATNVNNVDITSITDVGMETGCCWARIVFDTKDPSVQGSKLKVLLRLWKAKKVFKLVKNLMEEDELKSEFDFCVTDLTTH